MPDFGVHGGMPNCVEGVARRQIFQDGYHETEVMTVKKIKIRKLSKLEDRASYVCHQVNYPC